MGGCHLEVQRLEKSETGFVEGIGYHARARRTLKISRPCCQVPSMTSSTYAGSACGCLSLLWLKFSKCQSRRPACKLKTERNAANASAPCSGCCWLRIDRQLNLVQRHRICTCLDHQSTLDAQSSGYQSRGLASNRRAVAVRAGTWLGEEHVQRVAASGGVCQDSGEHRS